MFKKAIFLLLVFIAAMIEGDSFSQTYIKGPALIQGVTSIVSAATTTTLTKDSQTNQLISGVTTQTIKLPSAATIPIGRQFNIQNRSTGLVTVQYNDATTATTILANMQKTFILSSVSTTNGSWDITNINAGGFTGILPIANGGTNSSTALNNNRTIVSSSGAIIESAAGSAGQVWQSQGASAPAYSTATYPSTATATGTLLRADGTNWVATTLTIPNTIAAPSSLAANSTNVITAISGSTANRVMRTDGSTISFAQVAAATDITGVLPIANGGTNGTATPTAGGLASGTGTAYAFSAAGTTGQAAISGGTGASTWFAPTAGSVLFAGASGILAQNNAQFFWDNSANFLGIGLAAPATKLHIDGGTGTMTQFSITNGSTSGQTSTDGLSIGIDATANAYINDRENTNLAFSTNGSQRVRLTSAGSVVIGDNSAALATNATAGFLYIPTSAGIPTGTAGTQTGTVGMEYDTTNDNLYVYNAAWKAIGPKKSWSGSLGGANIGLQTTTTSGSFIEMTDGSLTFTPDTNSSAISVCCASTNACTAPSTSASTCAAGNESNGVNFTITETGLYEACVDYSIYSESAATTLLDLADNFEIVETPTNAVTVTQSTKANSWAIRIQAAVANQNFAGTPITECRFINFSSVGTKALRLFYATGSGTATTHRINSDNANNRDIYWSIRQQ